MLTKMVLIELKNTTQFTHKEANKNLQQHH